MEMFVANTFPDFFLVASFVEFRCVSELSSLVRLSILDALIVLLSTDMSVWKAWIERGEYFILLHNVNIVGAGWG